MKSPDVALPLLDRALELDASDTTLSAGAPATYRVHGRLHRHDLVPERELALLRKYVFDDENSRQAIEAFYYKGRRFRFTAYDAADGRTFELRLLPEAILPLEKLNPPPALLDLIRAPRGLIIVTGPTGSGKSTTLAAVISHINNTDDAKIETLEDPIEYVHTSRKSLIKQLQLGKHFTSFPSAIVAAMRHDPDILMVGEMRDVHSMRAALSAAETGHLVFGTMHSPTAARAIARISDATDSPEVREQLAGSLRAIVAQQLVAKTGSGRCAAYELLVNNTATASAIRANRLDHLQDEIHRGRNSGMIAMDYSLEQLARAKVITKDEALRNAVDISLLTKTLTNLAA